jgi:RimJ/RimL family protein N-acetyltransferase
VIRTERLVLRPPAERDVPAIVAGCSDPAVARNIPLIPAPYTERDARAWLAADEERRRASGEVTFAITRPGEDVLLGVISVRLRPGGSIGYWIAAPARGQGLMPEALMAVVAWARDEHGIPGLHLTTHPDNAASQRVAEKAGFTRTGLVDHEPRFADGVSRAVRFEAPTST